MNDWLEIILYLTAAAVICGLRYLSRKLHAGEQDDGVRTRLLDVSKKGNWIREWLLPGRHTHEPGTPQIKGEDEQREHVAQETVRRPRRTRAMPEERGNPTRSRFEPPDTTLPTPMYRGRPARLWWLPEQEVPAAPGDAARQTMLESVGCTKCGGLNPADSAFCGECGLFFESRDSATDPGGALVTGRRRRAASSRRNWQLATDRSVVKWRQGR